VVRKCQKNKKKVLDQIALNKLKQINKKKKKKDSDGDSSSSGSGSGSGSGSRVYGNHISTGTDIDVQDYKVGGKYTHLSLRFMKKYNLGHYAKEKEMFDSMIGVLGEEDGIDSDDEDDDVDGDDNKKQRKRRIQDDDDDGYPDSMSSERMEKGLGSGDDYHDSDNDDDDSDDWVAKAFLDEGNLDEEIGIDDFYGDYEKDRKIRKNIDVLEAAYASKDEMSSLSTVKRRKIVKVNKSDKDGGAGVLGRLRAVGTNGVSSRIFGAYPGDAVSIEDAASADGVIELAERYGYGDWSDDDYDSDDYDDFGIGGRSNRRGHGKKRRVGPSRKKMKRKKKKKKSSFNNLRSSDKPDDNFSVSFEFGSNPSEISFNVGNKSSRKKRKRSIGSSLSSSRVRSRSRSGSRSESTNQYVTRRSQSSSNKSQPTSTSSSRIGGGNTIDNPSRINRPTIQTSKNYKSLGENQKEILRHGLESRSNSGKHTNNRKGSDDEEY
jgi:hypothetical protein